MSSADSVRLSLAQMPARPKKPQKVIWFMAIASDEKVQPCRTVTDCPRAVQRAENMFDEYALYGAHYLVCSSCFVESKKFAQTRTTAQTSVVDNHAASAKWRPFSCLHAPRALLTESPRAWLRCRVSTTSCYRSTLDAVALI